MSFPSFLSSSLLGKQARRGDPSVGTAELGDQPALLRILDKEEVREVEWETI